MKQPGRGDPPESRSAAESCSTLACERGVDRMRGEKFPQTFQKKNAAKRRKPVTKRGLLSVCKRLPLPGVITAPGTAPGSS